MVVVKHKTTTFWSLFRNPVFSTQLLLLLSLLAVLLTCTIKQHWPCYDVRINQFFFLNIGTALSLSVMEIASLLSWIAHENSNWVHYVLTYIMHGVFIIACAVIFFLDSVYNFDSDKFLWPSHMNKNTTLKEREATTFEFVSEGILFFLAGAYLCLTIYIAIVKHKFAN